MASPQPASETTLRISRLYPAPREQVFRAWTDPKALERWFGPDPEFVMKVPILELRPGGRYRFEMRKGDATHIAVGEYREIRPPEKLVYTWKWEVSEMAVGFEDTIVTLEFHDRGQATELILIHEKLPTAEERAKHEHGWKGCLDQLASYISKRSAA
jgi:uncharacterized protein YndB with AHSA1/START domain